jgi:hypothetical protein
MTTNSGNWDSVSEWNWLTQGWGRTSLSSNGPDNRVYFKAYMVGTI